MVSELAEPARKAERAAHWRLELAETRAHPFHFAKTLPARAGLGRAVSAWLGSTKTECTPAVVRASPARVSGQARLPPISSDPEQIEARLAAPNVWFVLARVASSCRNVRA